MSLDEEINLGADARTVLESAAFHAAFERLTADITDKWKTSPPRDAEGREKLFLMLGLVGTIRSNLEAMVAGGTMAEVKRRSLIERARDSFSAWSDGSLRTPIDG